MSSRNIFILVFGFFCCVFASANAQAQQYCYPQQYGVGMRPNHPQPGWEPYVFAPPQVRQRLFSTPIELRPYRPMHLYGNTVRRSYYRGSILPSSNDFYRTASSRIW